MRGPLLERVSVHVPQCRGHNFILKNVCASFGKNRKSVTKAHKSPDSGLLSEIIKLANFFKYVILKNILQTNAARISRHLQPSGLRRRLTKSRGHNGV